MAELSIREALNEALFEEMERDPDVFLIGEEVGHYNGAYKVSRGLLDKFGEQRVVDTPIAENGFAGLGVGAAITGLRPIVEFMTFNFSLIGIDQVINAAAKLRYMSGGQFTLPIVFRGPSGAVKQLAAQHSSSFESFFANVPGLKVVMPATPKDAKGLLKTSIRDNDPVVFMESEAMYMDKGEVPEGEYTINIGEADFKRRGDDITIICYAKSVPVALQAAEILAEQGTNADVIDLRTIKPLDFESITESVKRTNKVVIVQEACPAASVGSWVSQLINQELFDYLDGPVFCMSGEDCPYPYATSLEPHMAPTPESVVDTCKRLL